MASAASPDPLPTAAHRSSAGSHLPRRFFSHSAGRPQDFKRLVFVVVATIGLGLGAAIACVWRPDALAALTLIPAWCWLLAGLVSTIPAWRIRSRWIACTLTVLWVAFAIGWVEELSSVVRAVLVTFVKSKALPENDRLRIVSLNCDSNERCLSDLQRVNPDVVLLQEAPGNEALANMARRLFGDAGSFLGGGDTAILARGTIRPWLVDRSAQFVAGMVLLEDGREIRCVSLRLAPPPSRLDFWTFGFWSDHRDMRKLHRRQLRHVMARIREIPAPLPLLVGGDFNTTGPDRALDELRPQLSDAFDGSGIGWGATGTNDWPLFRVDQVWTNSRLVPICVGVEKTTSSDHRLVVCDVVLQD